MLFLGLGRLPALFWLIGWSAASDDGFKGEIIELFEGKGLNNASDTLKQVSQSNGRVVNRVNWMSRLDRF